MKTAIALALGAVLFAFGARAADPIVLSPEEGAKQGKALAAEILAQSPVQNSRGVLKIKDAKGKRIEVPVVFQSSLNHSNWKASYHAQGDDDHAALLVVERADNQPVVFHSGRSPGEVKPIRAADVMKPFAGSDFWIADLGLEFLQWPQQRVLRKEIRRGQSCDVLESINPNPVPGGYKRVLSWVDIDSGGIMNAEAFDVKGKRIKEFAVKKIRKVEGHWQLQEIEMYNSQAKSTTVMVFDTGGE